MDLHALYTTQFLLVVLIVVIYLNFILPDEDE